MNFNWEPFNQDKHAPLDVLEKNLIPNLSEGLKDWENTYTKLLAKYEPHQICPIFYQDLLDDVINAVRPCVNFLGFEINEILGKCMRDHQKGNFKRKRRPEDEIEKIMALIPSDILQNSRIMKEKVFALFKGLRRRDEL